MPDRKKFWKRFIIITGSIFVLLVIVLAYMFSLALDSPPDPGDTSSLSLVRSEPSKGFYVLGNNWFRKSKSGLYEMYIEGKPFERGVVIGKLAKELVMRQEDNFNEQINRMIPSKFYLHFLKYFVGWFNRHLDENVALEYKREIYGVSEAASDKYLYIGSNYQRFLNYHAAHDIGHALQSMALVGCTSFGTWDARSKDSTMIIGRNFDFYVGDKFAEDKIVAFINPDSGYKFMMITWGGFMGVVSGMNEKGLTVTVNAAKSAIPSGSATPVSIVGREILQYAKNIDEAFAIASKRKMFVSESFLIGSAEDHKAVVIEKTPDTLDVFDPHQDYITCANHFQGDGLAQSEPNIQQMNESASKYRFDRLSELMGEMESNTVQQTVDILRDQKGLHGEDIGMGNEKVLNQLLAHHSIVFEPQKLLVWVSTSPWQLGPFVAYDLKKCFALRGMKTDQEITVDSLMIREDPFIYTDDFQNYLKFRKYRQMILDGKDITIDSLLESNPLYYHTWVIAGDYCNKRKQYEQAISYYNTALSKEVATLTEANAIREKILACRKKLSEI